MKAHNGVATNHAAPHQQDNELRRTLDHMRAERDEYEQAADALARALSVLTVENDTLRRQGSHLRERSGPAPLTAVT